jgi:hypothetical protein
MAACNAWISKLVMLSSSTKIPEMQKMQSEAWTVMIWMAVVLLWNLRTEGKAVVLLAEKKDTGHVTVGKPLEALQQGPEAVLFVVNSAILLVTVETEAVRATATVTTLTAADTGHVQGQGLVIVEDAADLVLLPNHLAEGILGLIQGQGLVIVEDAADLVLLLNHLAEQSILGLGQVPAMAVAHAV